jgi:hypothetical protein
VREVIRQLKEKSVHAAPKPVVFHVAHQESLAQGLAGANVHDAALR